MIQKQPKQTSRVTVLHTALKQKVVVSRLWSVYNITGSDGPVDPKKPRGPKWASGFPFRSVIQLMTNFPWKEADKDAQLCPPSRRARPQMHPTSILKDFKILSSKATWQLAVLFCNRMVEGATSEKRLQICGDVLRTQETPSAHFYVLPQDIHPVSPEPALPASPYTALMFYIYQIT